MFTRKSAATVLLASGTAAFFALGSGLAGAHTHEQLVDVPAETGVQAVDTELAELTGLLGALGDAPQVPQESALPAQQDVAGADAVVAQSNPEDLLTGVEVGGPAPAGQLDPAELGLEDIDPAELGLAELGLEDIDPAELGLAELGGLQELTGGVAEVQPGEVEVAPEPALVSQSSPVEGDPISDLVGSTLEELALLGGGGTAEALEEGLVALEDAPEVESAEPAAEEVLPAR